MRNHSVTFQHMTCLLNLKQHNWMDIVALSDLNFNVILTFWSLTPNMKLPKQQNCQQ